MIVFFFFFQAEDGIRDYKVTGVQTCALPISRRRGSLRAARGAEVSNANRACVVLPTYDERENLPAIVPAILAASPELDVLVVDDDSPDGTGALADELAGRHPRV